MNEVELSLRDSIAMENCKSERELRYVILGIEARHKVEGISPYALKLWEQEKVKHIHRVLGVVTA